MSFYGQQTKLTHHTVMVKMHESLQGTDKIDASILDQKLHEFLKTADNIDVPLIKGVFL